MALGCSQPLRPETTAMPPTHRHLSTSTMVTLPLKQFKTSRSSTKTLTPPPTHPMPAAQARRTQNTTGCALHTAPHKNHYHSPTITTATHARIPPPHPPPCCGRSPSENSQRRGRKNPKQPAQGRQNPKQPAKGRQNPNSQRGDARTPAEGTQGPQTASVGDARTPNSQRRDARTRYRPSRALQLTTPPTPPQLLRLS
eukprot:6473389-Amphidinium_carterae.1